MCGLFSYIWLIFVVNAGRKIYHTLSVWVCIVWHKIAIQCSLEKRLALEVSSGQWAGETAAEHEAMSFEDAMLTPVLFGIGPLKRQAEALLACRNPTQRYINTFRVCGMGQCLEGCLDPFRIQDKCWQHVCCLHENISPTRSSWWRTAPRGDFSRFAAVTLDLRSLFVPIGFSTIQCNLLIFFLRNIWVYIYISIVTRKFCGKLAMVNKYIGFKVLKENKVALLGYLEDHPS